MKPIQHKPECFKLKSYAKVNLHLKVTGKKQRFHTLYMLNARVELFDELNISIATDDNFSSCITYFPLFPQISHEKNLITKAFSYFSSHLSKNVKIIVKVNKNIPPGSGLGGGSGNAAVCLRFFNQLWSIYSENDILNIAAELGSDVPFFLYDKPAIVKGIGEIIEALEFNIPTVWIVLVIPPFSCSTHQVFDRYDTAHQTINPSSNPVCSFSDLFPMQNDLLNSSVDLHPELSFLLQKIKETSPKGYTMSGSGSTCFGVYETLTDAENAKDKLATIYEKVFLTQIKQ